MDLSGKAIWRREPRKVAFSISCLVVGINIPIWNHFLMRVDFQQNDSRNVTLSRLNKFKFSLKCIIVDLFADF